MEINLRHRDGVVILELKGKMIGNAGNDIKEVIDEALSNTTTPVKFLINLSNVSMMDSSGYGMLMGTQISIARNEGKIALLHVNRSIKSLSVRGRLARTFEHFDNEDEAIAALIGRGNQEGSG